MMSDLPLKSEDSLNTDGDGSSNGDGIGDVCRDLLNELLMEVVCGEENESPIRHSDPSETEELGKKIDVSQDLLNELLMEVVCECPTRRPDPSETEELDKKIDVTRDLLNELLEVVCGEENECLIRHPDPSDKDLRTETEDMIDCSNHSDASEDEMHEINQCLKECLQEELSNIHNNKITDHNNTDVINFNSWQEFFANDSNKADELQNEHQMDSEETSDDSFESCTELLLDTNVQYERDCDPIETKTELDIGSSFHSNNDLRIDNNCGLNMECNTIGLNEKTSDTDSSTKTEDIIDSGNHSDTAADDMLLELNECCLQKELNINNNITDHNKDEVLNLNSCEDFFANDSNCLKSELDFLNAHNLKIAELERIIANFDEQNKIENKNFQIILNEAKLWENNFSIVQNENKEMENKLKYINEENYSLKRELQILSEQTFKIVELEQKMIDFEEQKMIESNNFKSLLNHANLSEQNLAILQNDKQELENKLKHINEANNSLRLELEILSANTLKTAQLEKQIVEFEEQMKIKDKDFESFQNQSKLMEQNLSIVVNNKQELENKLKDINEENNSLRRELEILSDQSLKMIELEQKIIEFEEQKMIESNNFETLVNEAKLWEQNFSIVENDRQELENKLKDINKKNNDLNRELEILSANTLKTAQLEKQIIDFEEQMKIKDNDFESLQNQSKLMEQNFSIVEKDKKDLENKLKDMNEEKNGLKLELEILSEQTLKMIELEQKMIDFEDQKMIEIKNFETIQNQAKILEQNLSIVENDRQELENKLKDINEANNALRLELEILSAKTLKTAELEKQIVDFEEQMKIKDKDFESLQNQSKLMEQNLSIVENDRQELENKLKDINEKNNDLNRELEILSANTLKTAELEKQIIDFEEQMKIKDKDFESLQNQSKLMEQNLSIVVNNKQELENKLKDINEENIGLRRELEILNEQSLKMIELEQKIIDFEEQKMIESNNFEALLNHANLSEQNLAIVESDKQELENKLKDINEANNGLRLELEILSAKTLKTAQLEKQIVDFEEQMKIKDKDFESLQNQSKLMEQNFSIVEKDKQDLENKLKDINEENNSLRRELEILSEQSLKMIELEQKIIDFEEQKMIESNKFETLVNEAKLLEQNFSIVEKDKKDLENKLKDINEENIGLRRELEILSDQSLKMIELEQKIIDFEEQKMIESNNFETIQNQAKLLKQNLLIVENDRQELENKLKDINEKNNELNRELEILSANTLKTAELEKQIIDFEEQMKIKDKDFESLQNQSKLMEQNLSIVVKNKQELENKLKDINEENNGLRRELEILNEQSLKMIELEQKVIEFEEQKMIEIKNFETLVNEAKLWEQNFSIVEKDKKDLENKLKDINEEKNVLKRELEVLSEQTLKTTELEKKIVDLEEQKKIKNRNCELLLNQAKISEKKLSIVENEKKELENKLKDISEEKKDLKGELDFLNEENNKLNEDLNTYLDRCREARNELKQEKLKSDSMVGQWRFYRSQHKKIKREMRKMCNDIDVLLNDSLDLDSNQFKSFIISLKQRCNADANEDEVEEENEDDCHKKKSNAMANKKHPLALHN